MKRHIQEPGVRRWFGEDLIELQAEPLKAIDGFLRPYESCVLSGCEITGTTTLSIAPGLLLFAWHDGAVRRSVVVEFAGASGLPTSFTRWLTLEQQPVVRPYNTGETKPIAVQASAVLHSAQPAEPFIVFNQSGARTFRDALQSASYRFTTDTEKQAWNNKAPTTLANTNNNGLMSAGDKVKLNGIEDNANNYMHPTSHPAEMIATDPARRFVTDAERRQANPALVTLSQINPQWDVNTGFKAQLTLNANRALSFSNIQPGDGGILIVSNTGGFALAFPVNSRFAFGRSQIAQGMGASTMVSFYFTGLMYFFTITPYA